MNTDAVVGEDGAEVIIKKMNVMMSPQDMIIVCDGERIRAHSVSLHQCEHFATLLENADLGSYGPDNIRTID
jgi:hypothetical protein